MKQVLKYIFISLIAAILIIVLMIYAIAEGIAAIFKPFIGVKMPDDDVLISRVETLLEEKYGERFRVKEYRYPKYNEAIVYPVSNPECLFKARYAYSETVMKKYAKKRDSITYDTYIERNIELKYKHLAEEKLDDFKYYCYVDASLSHYADVTFTDPDISLEEFKKKYANDITVSYNLFVPYETIEKISYEEFYENINSIAENPELDNVFVVTFFLDKYYFESVVEASKNGKSIYDVIGNQKDSYVTQAFKNRKLELGYKEFCDRMYEIRGITSITDQIA